MKRKISKFIGIILIALTLCKTANAKIRNYTWLEKIQNSTLIVLAELTETKGSFKKINAKSGKEDIFKRYATYKVKEVLKGSYNTQILQIDYKEVNDKYEPFECRPPTFPNDNEKLVLLFLENEKMIFEGFQGKLYLKKDNEKAYVEAFRELTKIASIDNTNEKEKKLLKVSNSKNNILKNISKEIIVESWEFKGQEYIPVLIEVLGDTKAETLLRMRAVDRLSSIKIDNALQLFSKYLYDNNQSVRTSCAKAIGESGDKRGVAILEKFIQQERYDIAITVAKTSLKKLKEKQ